MKDDKTCIHCKRQLVHKNGVWLCLACNSRDLEYTRIFIEEKEDDDYVFIDCPGATLYEDGTNEVVAGHADESARESVYPRMTDDELLSGLFDAAAVGDVETIKNIVDQNPGFLNAQTRRGMTPIALAAWHDHLDAVEYLLARGADPDVKNHNGLTPLFCAVDRSRKAMARLLVRGGADLTTRGYRGRTLLHMAARSGDAGLAQTLIDSGAGVNATDVRGVTPLDLAAWHQKQSVASILNSRGAIRSSAAPPVYKRAKRLKKTA